MNVLRGALVPFLLSLIIIGCGPSASDIVVLQVGPAKVSMKEFEDFFTRNSGGWDAARQSSLEEREHFLELLTNYKLKLLDAYDHHLMSDSEIVQELGEYRGSLASTYMLEKELTEPGMRQIFERRKEEIRAKNILIKVSPDASPADSLAAYNKAIGLIKRLQNGERFDSLAKKYSDDVASKINGGDLYYFTSGQMVSSFENAAYGMSVGEISAVPARTSFGYHILQISDRKPARGSIRVRHMMARFQSLTPDSADTASALVRIKGLQDSLKNGWEFAKLAVKTSEDQGSAQQAGDLGWFERRRWVLPFDEAAFALKVGETSGIVRTPWGYHLLHCDSAKPSKSFDELKEELKKLYQQHRYTEDYADYLAKIKKDVKYSFDEGTFNSLVARLDSLKVVGDSAWDGTIPRDVRSLPLMMINGHGISLDTVITALGKRAESRNTSLRRRDIRPHIDRIAESFLLESRSNGLELRYPEFAALMKEYNDGVILYKAEQLEVWNKTSVSDSALKAYYESNKTKFMFSERVNVAEIDISSDTLAAKLYDSLSHGSNFAKLASRYDEDSTLKSSGGARGLQPIETDEVTKHTANLGVNEISEPFAVEDGSYVIIKLLAREPAHSKTFEEAGGEISNSYQEYMSKQLEQQWLERIRQKYPVTQFKEQLRGAFASPHATR